MATTLTPVAAPRQQFINFDLVRRIVLCNGLNGTSRSVLLTVGMHANKERQQCFCSIATLAHKSGWSRRTITEHLTRLQQLGYLSLIGTHHSGTSIYQVRLERLPADDVAAPPPPVEPPATPCADGAPPSSANCVPPTQNMPAPHAPTAHKEEVEQGLEQPRKEEAASSAPTAHGGPPVVPAAEAAPSARSVICFRSSLPTGQMDANTIGQLNTQRQRNGKDPLAHRDIVQMGAEAAKAGLTPLAAAQWVLAGRKRNFFKAEFYAPPQAQQPVAHPSNTPPMADTPPRQPVPLPPEEQARQAHAREAGLAYIRQYLANVSATGGQAIATPQPGTSANTRWASYAIEQFVAGQPVSHYRLKVACEVLGIHPRTLPRSAAQVPVQSPPFVPR